MGQLYAALRAIPAQSTSILADQLSWLTRRDRNCDATSGDAFTACLIATTRARIDQLRSMANQGVAPGATLGASNAVPAPIVLPPTSGAPIYGTTAPVQSPGAVAELPFVVPADSRFGRAVKTNVGSAGDRYYTPVANPGAILLGNTVAFGKTGSLYHFLFDAGGTLRVASTPDQDIQSGTWDANQQEVCVAVEKYVVPRTCFRLYQDSSRRNAYAFVQGGFQMGSEPGFLSQSESGIFKSITAKLDEAERLRRAGISPKQVEELEAVYLGYEFGKFCSSRSMSFTRDDLSRLQSRGSTLEAAINNKSVTDTAWKNAKGRSELLGLLGSG